MNILTIRELRTYVYSLRGIVKAVDGVSFEIGQGETVGLVGETGCGKTMTALSIVRLIPRRAKIVSGEVIFEGENLLGKTDRDMRKVRGRKIAMIFQDPNTSLNPLMKVGNQVAEALLIHEKMPRKKAKDRVIQAFKSVGIPDPSRRFTNYPHELSGGMKQRVMIAMGLLFKPSLLIADEPTTALDTTIQAQILQLMKELKSSINSSILLITHNIGMVAEMCDKVGVMYGGRVVEFGPVVSVLSASKHPYTSALLAAYPRRNKELAAIPGTVPDPVNPPLGCKFHPRCPYTMDICRRKEPVGKVACHLYS
jgi:oligopeptide/dipeptide ABC transporter ATP-binding protein